MNKINAIIAVIAVSSAVTGFLLSRSAARPTATVTAPVPAAGLALPDTLLVDVTGHRRPDFSLPDLTGRIRTVSEWDGRVLAVNFWASWCAPCLQEIPELVDLQTRFGSSGLQIVGIALQKPEELPEFVNQHKMNYPVLAGEAPVIEIAENFGNTVGALPYTAIMDRNGRIVFVKAGPVTTAEVESVIKPLLHLD